MLGLSQQNQARLLSCRVAYVQRPVRGAIEATKRDKSLDRGCALGSPIDRFVARQRHLPAPAQDG